jgi:hypothetical protein
MKRILLVRSRSETRLTVKFRISAPKSACAFAELQNIKSDAAKINKRDIVFMTERFSLDDNLQKKQIKKGKMLIFPF